MHIVQRSGPSKHHLGWDSVRVWMHRCTYILPGVLAAGVCGVLRVGGPLSAGGVEEVANVVLKC